MARKQQSSPRSNVTTHESFLRHANFRWAKLAVLICAAAIAAYLLIDVRPRPGGGTWYGYLLGTLGAALIVWLTLLGVRKRAMTDGKWSLKAWVSAHVYLGLALIVIATLHSGFQFGWNVHTLAYALMMLVIVSGLVGVLLYMRMPRRLSANRGETTQKQMIEAIRSLDNQLHQAAQPLDQAQAALVRLSLERTKMEGGLLRRMTGFYPGCGNAKAVARLARVRRGQTPPPGLDVIAALLDRKASALKQLRRHLQIKAILECWLYVHVPATFALLAALIAHIVSVFVYW